VQVQPANNPAPTQPTLVPQGLPVHLPKDISGLSASPERILRRPSNLRNFFLATVIIFANCNKNCQCHNRFKIRGSLNILNHSSGLLEGVALEHVLPSPTSAGLSRRGRANCSSEIALYDYLS
jgi:hypothetical protein